MKKVTTDGLSEALSDSFALGTIAMSEMPQHETFGQRLRAARRRRGLTQGELAHRAQVLQTYVSRFERDCRLHVRSDVLVRLALALGVSTDWLLGLPDLERFQEHELGVERPQRPVLEVVLPPQKQAQA